MSPHPICLFCVALALLTSSVSAVECTVNCATAEATCTVNPDRSSAYAYGVYNAWCDTNCKHTPPLRCDGRPEDDCVCVEPTPSPTPSPTLVPTQAPTVTPTPTPTASPTVMYV